MSEPLPIGKIISGPAHRDAIHVAIAPVEAGQELSPGQHVAIVTDHGRHLAVENIISVRPIGIVDPFIAGTVKKGQRFYLFLYPNTVTSIRHHWTHPAFTGEPEFTPASDAKQESEQWLRDFAARTNTNYGAMLEGIEDGGVVFGDDDGPNEARLHIAELVYHASMVLGKPIRLDEYSSFSCSC